MSKPDRKVNTPGKEECGVYWKRSAIEGGALGEDGMPWKVACPGRWASWEGVVHPVFDDQQ